jgi:hypothetical protein
MLDISATSSILYGPVNKNIYKEVGKDLRDKHQDWMAEGLSKAPANHLQLLQKEG